MANLAELLEEQAGRRVAQSPRLEPNVEETPVSAIMPTQSPASSGIDSLLPSLLQLATQGGGMQNGMQPSGGGSNWENVARRIATNRYGYSPGDFNALDSIIERESSWNPNAVNESSGAAGIAQRISGYGPGYSQDRPKQQINWLLNYIEDRYGSPQAALAFKDREGWY